MNCGSRVRRGGSPWIGVKNQASSSEDELILASLLASVSVSESLEKLVESEASSLVANGDGDGTTVFEVGTLSKLESALRSAGDWASSRYVII